MSRDPRLAMDRMYRHQRHIYDLTRKFYLLGRDRLIDTLELRPGERVCEVGCGTGRNLIALARRHAGVACYGIDASQAMLQTARAAVDRAGLGERIQLRHGLAEELDPGTAFGLESPFDVIVFAYSLSMIPTWRLAIGRAIAALRPGGTIAIVDFWDQRDLPAWFARSLRAWLALFDVHPRPELIEELRNERGIAVSLSPLYRGYAADLRCIKSA
jgi:S-adenosylmethionine-diacylgycerolhomoserine-N-methlytransferase